MDIASTLKKFSGKQTLMRKHPLRDSITENKKGYLYGLALIMSTGVEFTDKEHEYLSSLIGSLNIDSDLLNDFIEFVKNPNKQELSVLKRVLKRESYRIPFFIDTFMLFYQDGKYPLTVAEQDFQYFQPKT